MSETNTRTYQPHLDLLRIFATFCVIALHALSPLHASLPNFGTRTWHAANILNEICRTGVPLFLMLTGCLLLPAPSTRDFGKFYRRRLSRILIPFLCWDVIYYVAYRIHNEQPIFQKLFFDELFYQGSAYHLWYIYTLVGIYLILPFLARALEKATNRQVFLLLVIITALTVIRPLLNLIPFVSIYLGEPIMEGYLGFVIFGYWLSRLELEKVPRWAVLLCGIVGWVMGPVGNYLMSSPEGINLYFNGGYQLNHYLLAGAIFLGARYLRFPDRPRLMAFIRRVSNLTFTMYLAHVAVLGILPYALPQSTAAGEIVIYPPVCFVVCLGGAWVIDRVKETLLRLLPKKAA